MTAIFDGRGRTPPATARAVYLSTAWLFDAHNWATVSALVDLFSKGYLPQGFEMTDIDLGRQWRISCDRSNYGEIRFTGRADGKFQMDLFAIPGRKDAEKHLTTVASNFLEFLKSRGFVTDSAHNPKLPIDHKSGRHGYGTKAEKALAVRDWENLPLDERPILEEWLVERFGETGGIANVKPRTFHGWRKYVN